MNLTTSKCLHPIVWKNYEEIAQISTAFASITSGESVLSGVMATHTMLRWLTIIKGAANMSSNKLPPIHPGEILFEEFLEPMGISQYRIAKDIGVPPRRINEIVHGKRSISPDTALRLSRYFGMSERFWMNLQARYDLEVEKDKLADRLDDEVKVLVLQ